MDDFKRVCQQTCRAAYRLVFPVALLALAIGLSMAVEWLIALVVPKDSRTYSAFKFVVDLCLIGSAVINTIFSCYLLVADSWAALRSFTKQGENDT